MPPLSASLCYAEEKMYGVTAMNSRKVANHELAESREDSAVSGPAAPPNDFHA